MSISMFSNISELVTFLPNIDAINFQQPYGAKYSNSNVVYSNYPWDQMLSVKLTDFSTDRAFIKTRYFKSTNLPEFNMNSFEAPALVKMIGRPNLLPYHYSLQSDNCLQDDLEDGKGSVMFDSFNEKLSQESVLANFSQNYEFNNNPVSFLSPTLTAQDDYKQCDTTTSSSDLGETGSDICFPSKGSEGELDAIRNSVKERECSSKTTDIDITFVPPSKCIMPKSLMIYYNSYQRLDLPTTALGKPHFIHTYPQNGEVSLENVWKAHMRLLFRNVGHDWSLRYAGPKIFDSSYLCFKDFAKVRFYCPQCMDGWTSMCGIVLFFYQLNKESKCGNIYYQILGQKCGQCNPNFFEMPLWYPEEVQKVITNLYYDVATRVYDLQTPLPIKSRRMGQPVNHHNAMLCQGCNQGFCKRGYHENLHETEFRDWVDKEEVCYGSYDISNCSNVPYLSSPYIQGYQPEFNRCVPYCYLPPPYSPYSPNTSYSDCYPQMFYYYPCSAY